MSKLTKKLEQAIRQHTEKTYKILIVTKQGSHANDLDIKDVNQLMENIYSAELKGTAILELAEKKSIESIEPDEEVSIT